MTTPQQPGWSGDGYGSPAQGYGPPPAPGTQPPWSGSAGPSYTPPYGPLSGGQAPRTHGTAVVVLVLAISAFVVLPVIPAVVALALAPGAQRDIAAAKGQLSGHSLVRAGRIIAWVHLGLCAVVLLVAMAFFGLFAVVGFS